MFTDRESISLGAAVQDFHRARNQADLQALLGRLTGESNQLLSFDEVRQKLGLQGGLERGLRDIPLSAIVGSVGRYADFTRDFLPKRDINPERWARVKIAASGLIGLPPIEVYQIGDVYFVRDGNHRVSVALQMGATHIQAYVTEVQSPVPLTPDVQPDDLILIAEYNNFLAKTRLHLLRPESDLSVTIPGQYPQLLEHINVHRYYMGLDLQRDISYEEAVIHWFDAVYLPAVKIIREQAILHRFPDRTETDLYLWLARHRAEIEEHLGWKIPLEYAASDLVENLGAARLSGLSWLGERLFNLILPEQFEDGPPAGQWRSMTSVVRAPDQLFMDILVPINGREDGWCALDQSIIVAQRENARLHGLYIVKSEEKQNSPKTRKVQAEFELRCQKANVEGALSIAVSNQIAHTITQRAGYTDLVITTLAHPPSSGILARLVSGFRDLIVRSPRPILATPCTVSQLQRALLAYDGSPKAKEALYLAAYLAGKWKIPIVVLTVAENGNTASNSLEEAQAYLEKHNAQVTPLVRKGAVAEEILNVCQEHECDLIMMGGYGLNPVLEVVVGSVVDRVLRTSRHPVMICR